MKLYIPELGDQIKLIKDWKFDLQAENRNDTLANTMGYRVQYIPNHNPNWLRYKEGDPIPEGFKLQSDGWLYKEIRSSDIHWWVKDGEKNTHVIPITLSVDTILKVDRIYIRKGAKDFSSISFYITSKEKVKYTGKPIRFWAKLSDCNTIEFEKV
jgi:NAD+--asparagine ADP-ribosyltransferase